MTATKRCPHCGLVKPAEEFYQRRGRRLSSYCQPCTRAASHEGRHRRRQDAATAVELFYRRRHGRRLSSYCQACTRAASREARRRRRQDPATAQVLRAVDRLRQRRHRALGCQGGDGR